jgi:hypothetical protein
MTHESAESFRNRVHDQTVFNEKVHALWERGLNDRTITDVRVSYSSDHDHRYIDALLAATDDELAKLRLLRWQYNTESVKTARAIATLKRPTNRFVRWLNGRLS